MNYPCHKTAIAAAIAAAIANPQAGAQEAVDQAGEIEEVVVTGSRIKRTDLAAASPVSVIGSVQIAEAGTINVDSLLNEMPQVMPGWTATSNFPGIGTASVDLRGLGAKRTLVLVNGRRFLPTNGDGTVDITSVPTALVDRIEVVTGGASAVYGSDAIAGVVNFILDDEFEGFELGSSYNVTTDYGDGDIYSVNAKFGMNSADGRGNISVFAGYSNRSHINQGDRAYTQVALDDGFVNGVPTLVPGGSSSTEDGRMILHPSAIPPDIGDNINGNPNSIKFDNGAPLAWNDPQDRLNYAPPSYLQVPQERFQTYLFATKEINRRINVSLEGMFMHQESATNWGPQPRSLSGRDQFDFNFADNPYLTNESKAIIAASELITDAQQGFPTGDGIVRINSLSRNVAENGDRQDIRRFDVWRTLMAANGEIVDNFGYEAYYARGSSSNAHRVANRINNDKYIQSINVTTDPVTGEPVCIDPSGGCAPANIWGKGLISQEAVTFFRTAQNFADLYEQQIAGLTFTGNLSESLSFDAGQTAAAFGLEWREESFKSEPDSNAMVGDAIKLPTQGKYDVLEAFAEIDVPLLADSPAAKYLAINAAVRYSDYSTIGESTTWKAGVEWSPSFIPDLRIRGGAQKAIRAPNIIELFAPEEGAGLTIYQDPCDEESGLLDTAEEQAFCNAWGAPTGFVQLNGTVSALRNSNPNLEAEKADTWTAGFVYEPEALADNDFSLTMDYYSVDVEDAVAPFGGGVDNNITSCFFALDLSSEFCANVQRDFIGEILPINSQLTNVSLKKVAGIDLQFELAFDFERMPGRFDIFFLSTYQIDNGFKATEVLPFIECAGKFGVPCGGEIDGTGSPRLQANTRFGWSDGPYRLGLNWRWLEGMEDARIVRVQAFGLPVEPVIDTIPADAITTPNYNYVDIHGTWEFNDSTTFRLGFDNVFGKEPPLMGDAQIQDNTDPGTYDVIGRRVWASFTLQFE